MSTRFGEYSADDDSPDSEEVISVEGVKFFIMQAMQQDPFSPVPTYSNMSARQTELDLPNETIGLELDDRVIHSIKLMQHAKEMRQLIEATYEQKEAIADSQIRNMPLASEVPEHPVPSFIHKMSHPLRHMENNYSDFYLGKKVNVPEITVETAKLLLSKSVAALLAHAGFDVTTESILATAVDATETYIMKMVSMLRVAVDHGENVGSAGFPDAVERVFNDMGIGSVRALHDYYHENIVKVHEKLLEECRNLNLEYSCLAPNVKADILSFGDITKLEESNDVPELHFTMGDDGVDELQPSLGAGFQILDSLEQDVQLQNLDSQEETVVHDSPGQDSLDLHIAVSHKRKRT